LLYLYRRKGASIVTPIPTPVGEKTNEKRENEKRKK